MPQIRIEHRLGVSAPAYAVWEAVNDLSQWAEWNPVYASASGRLSIGAPITVETRFPDMPPQTIAGTLVDWVPDAQLVWRAKLGRFTNSLRYIEIEKLSDHGCILANGEIIDGFGARYISPRRRRSAYQAYEQMNEALKARAEARWRETLRAPTSQA